MEHCHGLQLGLGPESFFERTSQAFLSETLQKVWLIVAHCTQEPNRHFIVFPFYTFFFFSVFGSCSDRMFDGDVTEEEEELKKMLSAHSKREPRYIRYL